MRYLQAYMHRMGWKRFWFVVLGNVFLGMGIGLFMLTNTGCDPYSAMNIEVSQFTPVSYGTFQLLVNLVLFILELSFGRELVGFGTIVNACFLGYINSFFFWFFGHLLGTEFTLVLRLAGACAAVVVCSFGLSMYQTPNAGVSPYDSMAMILTRRMPKVSYFWWRMLCDVTCSVICLGAGGLVTGNLGPGTLICAFCFGPVISFFNRVFSEKHVSPM